MEVSNELKKLYGDYYLDQKVLTKRKISARQSVAHIKSILPPQTYRSVIDIGAGDGSVLEELNNTDISNELHAVEISESGCACIQAKNIAKVHTIRQFDGYNIPAEDSQYEIGLAIHVLEHVEHERSFLHEMSRTCDYLYIEVPLELTLKLNRNIALGAQFGHINFYNPTIFQNLLRTCNLEILSFKVFSASLEYEQLLSGTFKGAIKHYIRSIALKFFPRVAPKFITYMGGAYCRVRK